MGHEVFQRAEKRERQKDEVEQKQQAAVPQPEAEHEHGRKEQKPEQSCIGVFRMMEEKKIAAKAHQGAAEQNERREAAVFHADDAQAEHYCARCDTERYAYWRIFFKNIE